MLLATDGLHYFPGIKTTYQRLRAEASALGIQPQG